MVFGGKIGEGWTCDVDPNELIFYFWVFTYVPIFVKIDQETRPWACAQTDRRTDAYSLCKLVFGRPYYRSRLRYVCRLSSVTFCIVAKWYVLA